MYFDYNFTIVVNSKTREIFILDININITSILIGVFLISKTYIFESICIYKNQVILLISTVIKRYIIQINLPKSQKYLII